MRRIALGVEYYGADYNGWHRQSSLPSIQASLEQAISKVANQQVPIFCAGRTDQGVHATGQVIHFDYDDVTSSRELSAWILGGNTLLPHDISINWAQDVPNEFHARFSAISRRYHYYIYVSQCPRALLMHKALWVRKELDTQSMQLACKYLLGEQDFSSFRSSQCESTSPNRNIISAEISVVNNFIMLDIKANAFLHHMVRNIVGCLLEIGLGNKPPKWLHGVIDAKDRTKSARTAPPDGLYLVAVEYKPEHALKQKLILPFSG